MIVNYRKIQWEILAILFNWLQYDLDKLEINVSWFFLIFVKDINRTYFLSFVILKRPWFNPTFSILSNPNLCMMSFRVNFFHNSFCLRRWSLS